MTSFLRNIGLMLILVLATSGIQAGGAGSMYDDLKQVAKPASPLAINFRKGSPLLDVPCKEIDIPHRQWLEDVAGFEKTRMVLAAYSFPWGRKLEAIVLVYVLSDQVQADMLLFEKVSGRFVRLQNIYAEIDFAGEVLLAESKVKDYTNDGLPDILVREYHLIPTENGDHERLTYRLYAWNGVGFDKFSGEGLESELPGKL